MCVFSGPGTVYKRSETRQWDHQTNHHFSDVHRKLSEIYLSSPLLILLFWLALSFLCVHISTFLLPRLSLWLSLVGPRSTESWSSAARRKSPNKTGACCALFCIFHFFFFFFSCMAVWPCLCLRFIRYAFLFDKAVIICKRKSGETFELKEIIELNQFQILDESTGEKDNKKVWYILTAVPFVWPPHPPVNIDNADGVRLFLCEQWSYVFLLLDCYGRFGYDLIFKTRELKKKWLEQFEMAMWAIAPTDEWHINKHTQTQHHSCSVDISQPNRQMFPPRNCWQLKNRNETSSSCCSP